LPFGDEINLVNPGFNSGYNKIDGIWLLLLAFDGTMYRIVAANK
jgi:hypothetical protein